MLRTQAWWVPDPPCDLRGNKTERPSVEGGSLFLQFRWDERALGDKRPHPFPVHLPLPHCNQAHSLGSLAPSEIPKEPAALSKTPAKVWMSVKGCVFLGEGLGFADEF